MEKRKHLTIIEEILIACRVPSSRTRLMYKVGLNYTRVVHYINLLLQHGLIKKNETSKGKIRYHITKKGEEFLRKLDELKEFMKLL